MAAGRQAELLDNRSPASPLGESLVRTGPGAGAKGGPRLRSRPKRMTAPAILISQLTKDYGGGRGLFQLDLQVERQRIFGFLGPNGAGKTTTIRMLMDMVRPTSGTASLLIFRLVSESNSVWPTKGTYQLGSQKLGGANEEACNGHPSAAGERDGDFSRRRGSESA